MMRIVTLILVFCIGSSSSYGQKLTLKDYDRAVSFARANYNNKTAFNLRTSVKWFERDTGLYFTDFDPAGKSYKYLDLKEYQVKDLFDHEVLASKLSDFSEKEVEAHDIELSYVEKVGDTLSFQFEEKSYVFHLVGHDLSLQESKPPSEKKAAGLSPDGKWIGYTVNNNLFIKSSDGSDSTQLTFDGHKNYEYGTYYGWFDKMEGENGDRPAQEWFNWSPDSKFLMVNLVDLRNADKMYMLDHSQDDLFRPKLYSYYRGSPGDTNMVHVTPKFFDVAKKSEVKLDLPRRTHINGISGDWTDQEGILVIQDVERGFKRFVLSQVDVSKGKIEQLFVEESETNIDNFQFWNLEKQRCIVFLSQRSGWNQLHKFDLTSREITPLTNGEYVVNGIAHVDEENGVFWISASGKDHLMNPYHQQVYKVSIDGVVELLTPEKLHHDISFSPDGKHFIDNMSTVEIKTKTVLRSSVDGSILAKLTMADVSQKEEKGWKPPTTFSMLGKDGKTIIYGAFWRPTNFDKGKKYPIIDHSYTGPHTQVFPKSFDRSFDNQALAELGFIVVHIDGLGTSGRSKEFLDHSYKNMGANLEDHVLAIKHLGNEYSWIDSDKVGIFGHSAGGYDAGHGMLAFPDFYKVGVASSADHDFRMEKAWWPEMYMGWPVDSTYHEVSNITLAPNLKGKLLLAHGNMDDNVNVSATYKLAEALIKADKEFDLLILPSQRHGYQGEYRKYFIKKRWNYFVEHLLDQEPIWDFEWE